MSRGRGSSGRGRGGPGFLKRDRIGGQEESYHHDAGLLIDTKPREFYPEIDIPKPPAPSRLERAQQRHSQTIRNRVRNGPMHTVLDESARIGKLEFKKSSTFNPFEDMPTYTQRYKPSSRTLPRFDTRRYSLNIFPKELWDIVRPKRGAKAGIARGAARTPRRIIRGDAGEGRRKGDVDEEEAKNKTGEDADEDIRDADDDAAGSESNPEDDFEDNDSDMAGDYNAEGYFDAGEDDADGLDGEGGDDGGFD